MDFIYIGEAIGEYTREEALEALAAGEQMTVRWTRDDDIDPDVEIYPVEIDDDDDNPTGEYYYIVDARTTDLPERADEALEKAEGAILKRMALVASVEQERAKEKERLWRVQHLGTDVE